MTNPSVNQATIDNPTSAASQTTANITVGGNFQLVISMAGNPVHVDSVSDTLSNAYSTLFGAMNNANNVVTFGGFHLSVLYCNSTATGTNAVTINYSGSTGTPTFIAYADCASVATTGSVIANIYNTQSSVANGTNAITVAGGTGSDNVTSAPALVVTLMRSNSGTVSAGSTPITFTSVATSGTACMLEYGVANGTGTFDSTATLTGGTGSATCNSFQIALAALLSAASFRSPLAAVSPGISSPF